MKAETQKDRILGRLRSGLSITPLEALYNFGCLRLGARVWDLREKGYDIETRMVKTESGAVVASYRLKKEA